KNEILEYHAAEQALSVQTDHDFAHAVVVAFEQLKGFSDLFEGPRVGDEGGETAGLGAQELARERRLVVRSAGLIQRELLAAPGMKLDWRFALCRDARDYYSARAARDSNRLARRFALGGAIEDDIDAALARFRENRARHVDSGRVHGRIGAHRSRQLAT